LEGSVTSALATVETSAVDRASVKASVGASAMGRLRLSGWNTVGPFATIRFGFGKER